MIRTSFERTEGDRSPFAIILRISVEKRPWLTAEQKKRKTCQFFINYLSIYLEEVYDLI